MSRAIQMGKRKRLTGQYESAPQKLLINSLMDAFIIVLIFLLRSFGADPVQIRESSELKLPDSTSTKPLEDAVVISVTASSILVDDRKVVDLSGGRVDEAHMRGGQDGLLIDPLFEALHEKIKHIQLIRARQGRDATGGVALIVAHRVTSYRLITEILYTAGQAAFDKFKFVATEAGRNA